MEAPTGLGEAGIAFWISVTKDYTLRCDEMQLLREACREIDLLMRLEDDLRGAGLTTTNFAGSESASPLVTELRQHRVALKTLLAALKLPAEDRHQVNTSEKGRRAAAARWNKKAG